MRHRACSACASEANLHPRSRPGRAHRRSPARPSAEQAPAGRGAPPAAAAAAGAHPEAPGIPAEGAKAVGFGRLVLGRPELARALHRR
eukprot:1804775-Alexandrium_andersonii.AAC.1